MCKALRDVPLTPEQMQPVVVAHLGLHSHTCSECGRECACYQVPCESRGPITKDTPRVWRCGFCKEGSEAAA